MNKIDIALMVLLVGTSSLCLALRFRRDTLALRSLSVIFGLGAILAAIAALTGLQLPVPDFIKIAMILLGLVLNFTAIYLFCRPRPADGPNASA